MRVGDFSVDVVAADGACREIESGHVLARPGQVYVLRLRNHGPLRCVTDVTIDGHAVTGGGLVIDAWSTVDLERPIHDSERGRFTVIAEGDERVFGPDGGRDNPDLGLIEARFRRELPNADRAASPLGRTGSPIVPMPSPPRIPESPEPSPYPRRPFTPEWTSETRQTDDGSAMPPPAAAARRGFIRGFTRGFLDAEAPLAAPLEAPFAPEQMPDAIERAAGTGLTGTSSQEFVRIHVGALETEATVIRLRLVISSDDAILAPRPLPKSDSAPARPVARP